MSYKNLLAPTARGNLSANGYFDKIQVWLRVPATRSELGELARHCGKGGIYWKTKGARFSNAYRQMVVARQPSETALEWITDRDDALVNGAEIALDTTYGNDREADAAFHYFYRHGVRSHHGKTQKIRFYRESNLYDGQRRHPNILTLYRTQMIDLPERSDPRST